MEKDNLEVNAKRWLLLHVIHILFYSINTLFNVPHKLTIGCSLMV